MHKNVLASLITLKNSMDVATAELIYEYSAKNATSAAAYLKAILFFHEDTPQDIREKIAQQLSPLDLLSEIEGKYRSTNYQEKDLLASYLREALQYSFNYYMSNKDWQSVWLTLDLAYYCTEAITRPGSPPLKSFQTEYYLSEEVLLYFLVQYKINNESVSSFLLFCSPEVLLRSTIKALRNNLITREIYSLIILQTLYITYVKVEKLYLDELEFSQLYQHITRTDDKRIALKDYFTTNLSAEIITYDQLALLDELAPNFKGSYTELLTLVKIVANQSSYIKSNKPGSKPNGPLRLEVLHTLAVHNSLSDLGWKYLLNELDRKSLTNLLFRAEALPQLVHEQAPGFAYDELRAAYAAREDALNTATFKKTALTKEVLSIKEKEIAFKKSTFDRVSETQSLTQSLAPSLDFKKYMSSLDLSLANKAETIQKLTYLLQNENLPKELSPQDKSKLLALNDISLNEQLIVNSYLDKYDILKFIENEELLKTQLLFKAPQQLHELLVMLLDQSLAGDKKATHLLSLLIFNKAHKDDLFASFSTSNPLLLRIPTYKNFANHLYTKLYNKGLVTAKQWFIFEKTLSTYIDSKQNMSLQEIISRSL